MVGETLKVHPDRVEALTERRVTAAQQRRVLEALVERRIRTRKPAAYLLQRIYMRGVPFYIDERAIVPRSYLGEILDDELFETLIRSRRRSSPCSISAPARAVSRSSRRCGFRTRRSMPPICRRTRWRSPRRTWRCTACSAASGSRRAICSRRCSGERYDLIVSNPPYVDAKGMRGLPPECRHEPRSRSTAARTASRSCGGSSSEAGPPSHAGWRAAVRGRPLPSGARARLSAACGFSGSTPKRASGEVFWLDAGQLR